MFSGTPPSSDPQKAVAPVSTSGDCGHAVSDAYDPFRKAWSTADAPDPAGSYSQAVTAEEMLYISGQTPRSPDGTRCPEADFAVQARAALNNVEAIAAAAGTKLAKAAMVTVYLTNPSEQAATFDQIYQEFLDPDIAYPARAIVQSALPHGAIEITAVIPH